MLKHKLPLLAIFIMVITRIHMEIDEEDDPDLIENHTLEYYRIKRPPEITKNCAVQEMNAYSLSADSSSLSEPNPICPSVTNNCCGPKDQKRIEYYWRRDRKYQENYHRVVLKIYRYILGWGKQYAEVAQQVIDNYEEKKRNGEQEGGAKVMKARAKNENEEGLSYTIDGTKFCAKAAKDMLQSDFYDRRKAEAFYASLTTKVEFLENTRKSFYCTLCAGEAKKHFGTHWAIFDWAYNDRVFYDRSFCGLIHDWTFATVYQTWKSFRPYVSDMMKMLTCVQPQGAGGRRSNVAGGGNRQQRPGFGIDVNVSINFDLNVDNPISSAPAWVQKMFEHPGGIKHKGGLEVCDGASPEDFWFFVRCEYYCQNWNIAKPSTLFDGNAKRMKQLYDHLKQYEFALINDEQNLFRDDVVMLKRDIEENWDSRPKNKAFYRSISSHIKLDKYKSDFLMWWQGMHPMEIAEGTTLVFEYTSAGILRALALLALALAF